MSDPGADGPLPFGDAAWLVPTGTVDRAHRLAAAVGHPDPATGVPPGAVDAVVGFGSVVVRLAGADGEPGPWEAWLAEVVGALADGPPQEDGPGPPGPGSRTVDVPTAFDGPDLAELADGLDATPDEVVRLLTGHELLVAFLGFAPGFPYLVGLPPPLAAVARRATPRTSVPAGSVAVAGGFAAVYPQATPGGWHLLGRTDLPLFEDHTPPYALLRAGDRVRFRPGATVTAAAVGTPGRRPALTVTGSRSVEVREPGLFTSVQDGGRHGLGAIGVPSAGPADPTAMHLANRLAGNPAVAPALEVTARGPTLLAGADLHLAVVGAGSDAVPVTVDGRPVATDAVLPVGAGQEVTVGTVRTGLRAYLAVSGGFDGPVVAGSRSSDVLSGLGPGALVAGDRLPVGHPGHPHGLLVPAEDPRGDGERWTVRVVLGPHRFDRAAVEGLLAAEWQVGATSNRIGLRLTGPPLAPVAPGIPSTGMVTGAVQVPPDGQPIVLLVDHATVGGYPVIATVVSADLGALGQLRPGQAVRFEPIEVAAARRAAREERRLREARVIGWFPTDSGT